MIAFKNVLEIIESNRFYHKPVLFFYEDFKLRYSLTYDDIWQQSRKVAMQLLSEPVQSDRILISISNSPEFVFSFFGTLMAGLLPVPLPTREFMTQDDFFKMVKDQKEKLSAQRILCDKISIESLGKIKSLQVWEMPTRAQPKGIPSLGIVDSLDPEDICYIQISAKNTLELKPLELEHGAVLNNLIQMKIGLGLKSTDQQISWAPFYTEMGLLGSLLFPLMCRVPSHIMNHWDFVKHPEKFIKLVSDQKISVMLGPDEMFRKLNEIETKSLSGTDLSNVRLSLIGLDNVHAETCRRFINHFKPWGLKPETIIPIYGIPDLGLMAINGKMGRRYKSILVDRNALHEGNIRISSFKDESIEIISSGVPLPEVQVKIASLSEEPLPQNSMGHIWIKSNYSGQWLRSDDFGFIYENEVFVIGSKDEIFEKNQKIYFCSDVERRILQIPGFENCDVVAVGISPLKKNSQQEELYVLIETSQWMSFQHNKMRQVVFEKLISTYPISKEKILFLPLGSVRPYSMGLLSRGKIKRQLAMDGIKAQQKYFMLKTKWHPWFLQRKFKSYSKARRKQNWRRIFKGFNSQLKSKMTTDATTENLKTIFARLANMTLGEVDLVKSFIEYQIKPDQLAEFHIQVGKELEFLDFADFITCENLLEVRVLLHQKTILGVYSDRSRPVHRESSDLQVEPDQGTILS